MVGPVLGGAGKDFSLTPVEAHGGPRCSLIHSQSMLVLMATAKN